MEEPKHEIIQGESITFKLSNRKETISPHGSGTLYIREMLKLAKRNDGRLLFTRSYGAKPEVEKTVDQIIMYEIKNPLALTGKIRAIGLGYDKDWNPECIYQTPVPWNMLPARKWYALDDVRPFLINPDDYYAETAKTVCPMKDVFTRGPLVYVVKPKNNMTA